ncbi:hypothetical protein HUJ04_005024 [Dendroctonus ponderosae]|nr:hypothetical protein HUJ04_005024 [Dendroctonus ponderosae]
MLNNKKCYYREESELTYTEGVVVHRGLAYRKVVSRNGAVVFPRVAKFSKTTLSKMPEHSRHNLNDNLAMECAASNESLSVVENASTQACAPR